MPMSLTCAGSAGGSVTAAPAVVAHRGASRDAPENTIAAFNLAWQLGADIVEGDFRLTGDGAIVCIHDATTRRTTGKDIAVAEAPLSQLRELDAGSWKGHRWKDIRIPTISEVLATVPEGKKVFIEVKCGPDILPPLTKALAESGLKREQAVVIAFDAQVIAETKEQLPQIEALWLTDFITDNHTGKISPSAVDILATLEKIGANGVDCKAHAVIDPRFMQTLRGAHKGVHVWTVDDAATAKRFAALGVDSLTTNRAGWLTRKLRGAAGRIAPVPTNERGHE